MVIERLHIWTAVVDSRRYRGSATSLFQLRSKVAQAVSAVDRASAGGSASVTEPPALEEACLSAREVFTRIETRIPLSAE